MQEISDDFSDYYYCPVCLWPGALVDKGNDYEAKLQFDRHKCTEYSSYDPVEISIGGNEKLEK